MRLYIAGPMSGYPEHNFPAFKEVYEIWTACGHDMVDPRLLNSLEDQKSWEACMRVDIRELVTCEGIVYLPGWEKSRGASLEMHIAKSLSMPDFDCRIPFINLEPDTKTDVSSIVFPDHWKRWTNQKSDEFIAALMKVNRYLEVSECQMTVIS